jgi:hypothetical protein
MYPFLLITLCLRVERHKRACARDFIALHCFFFFPSTHHSFPVSLIADFIFFAPIIDGFFDAGMLRQALNANRAQNEPVERDVIRRNIGRRLRLAEY